MSAPAINPEWGDDWMAIAEAVGITPQQHPETDVQFVPHPVHAEEFTNLALEITLGRWAAEVLDNLPIALTVTDHEKCGRCDVTICRCEDLCDDQAEDACGHLSQPACGDCAPFVCSDCASAWMRRNR